MLDVDVETIAGEFPERSAVEERRIADLVERYPLPPHMEDRYFNRAEIAIVFKVDEKQIDRWMNRNGFPVVQKGNNGKPYRFGLAECWAWKKHRDAEKQREREQTEAAIAQAAFELLGGSHNPDDEQCMTPKERMDWYKLDQMYLERAEQRGGLVPRREVVTLLEGVFELVRNAVNGMPDRLSRDAGLSGLQADQAVAIADDILAGLHQKVAEFGQRGSDPEIQPKALNEL